MMTLGFLILLIFTITYILHTKKDFKLKRVLQRHRLLLVIGNIITGCMAFVLELFSSVMAISGMEGKFVVSQVVIGIPSIILLIGINCIMLFVFWHRTY